MTDCAEALGLVEKLSDGEATTAESRAAESHLEKCSSCRGHLEFLVSLSKEARSMSFPEPPESYWEHLPRRVLDRIDSESGRPSGFFRILFAPTMLRWGALGATLLVMMAVGVSVLREDSWTPAPPAVTFLPARVPVAPVDPVNEVPKVPEEAEATAENQAQAIAEPTAAPPVARDEAAPAPAAPAETVATFESNDVVVQAQDPSLRTEKARLLESANRPRSTPAAAALSRVVVREECDELRRAVASMGHEPERPDTRYRLATCSLERYEREATEELRSLAIEDAVAFLAAESEGSRAEEIRGRLARIRPDGQF